jgi:SAM-dependent methyltransferase
MSDIEQLLSEQAHYYRERAGEYDDWWFRRGRYDHGDEANGRWFADVADVESAVEKLAPMGDVVELACGTGLWTRKLVEHADSVTAVDASREMIEINRERVRDPRVVYVEGDLFSWEPVRTYDVCFFSFWLSHVPEERFVAFWEKVGRALVPGGRAFFLDSSRHDLASAVDHRLPERGEQTMLRRLADGREFQIVKHFYEPGELCRRLAEIGWAANVEVTSEFFVYGQVTRV